MFHVAICEDCPAATKLILSLLDKYQADRLDVDIYKQSFDSGDALLKDLENGQSYDLFLLDILMPEKSGIELAHILRERDPEIPLIFLTSSTDYALDAFKVSATQYLLKPVEEDILFPLLDKIISAEKKTNESYFMLSMPERTVKMAFSTICFIEITGHVLCVKLDNGNTLFSKNTRIPFEKSIAPLLQDSRFLYPHKSFVLNMAHIQEMTGSSFVMTGGTTIPVPRYKYANAKAKYLDYLSGCGIGFLGGTRL